MFDVNEESCVSAPDRSASEKQYARSAIGFVLSGWFDYRSETGSATAVTGGVLFGNSGEQFSCRHNDMLGNRRLVVSFDREFLEGVAGGCGLPDSRFPLAALPPGKLSAAAFGRIRRLALRAPGHEEAAVELAAAALQAGRNDRKPRRISSRNQERVCAVMRHIENSYEEPCSLRALADLAQLSPYYFLRVFKAVTGQSPNQYVINTRLRAAAEQLLMSKAPVSQVAYSAGFHDISHFNSCFRTVFDCSPRQWRNGQAH